VIYRGRRYGKNSRFLPVFEEVTIGDEYLKDDKPIAVAGFGTAA